MTAHKKMTPREAWQLLGVALDARERGEPEPPNVHIAVAVLGCEFPLAQQQVPPGTIMFKVGNSWSALGEPDDA